MEISRNYRSGIYFSRNGYILKWDSNMCDVWKRIGLKLYHAQ